MGFYAKVVRFVAQLQAVWRMLAVRTEKNAIPNILLEAQLTVPVHVSRIRPRVCKSPIFNIWASLKAADKSVGFWHQSGPRRTAHGHTEPTWIF